MKLLTLIVAIALGASSITTPALASSATTIQEDKKEARDVSDFNLEDGVALEGYDPVAYFPEGGGKAKKGSKKVKHLYDGVTYYFSSQANLEAFKKDPAKYEPMYGGWCAFSMADEEKKVEPSPKNFLVEGGRLYVFFDGWFGDGRSAWKKKTGKVMKPKADKAWKAILEATKKKKAKKKAQK